MDMNDRNVDHPPLALSAAIATTAIDRAIVSNDTLLAYYRGLGRPDGFVINNFAASIDCAQAATQRGADALTALLWELYEAHRLIESIQRVQANHVLTRRMPPLPPKPGAAG